MAEIGKRFNHVYHGYSVANIKLTFSCDGIEPVLKELVKMLPTSKEFAI